MARRRQRRGRVEAEGSLCVVRRPLRLLGTSPRRRLLRRRHELTQARVAAVFVTAAATAAVLVVLAKTALAVGDALVPRSGSHKRQAE